MKVGIVSTRSKGNKFDRLELVKALEDEGKEVIIVGRATNDTLHEDYNRYGLQFLSLPLIRDNTNIIVELKTVFKIVQKLKQENINSLIIYGIRIFPLMMLAAKLAKIKKTVLIVNGSGRLFQLNGIKGKLIKSISYPALTLSFFLGDKVLVQNKDDLFMLKRKKIIIRKNYLKVNGSGVNVNMYPYEKLPSENTFIMISRLTQSKGVNEFLLAAEQIHEKYNDTKFILLGPLDEEKGLNIDLLDTLQTKNILNYLGNVDDIREYMKRARCFVLPSYYPEGIPRAILEAMSMGRPIITTDSSGCRETVSEGVNGFLVKPKKVDDLVYKMEWIINNSDKVEQLGINSRLKAEREFNVKNINDVIINAINS